MDKLSPEAIGEFQATILENFAQSGRRFPWRETHDPYRILVSEIMLQQTQTDRVVPRYLDWLETFPTVEALAKAPFARVLEKWIGLGYNRRARYLQEACKSIVDEYGNAFPRTPSELEKLPGVGKYTASAVSTFAFGLPNAFIETNIRAVYLFFFYRDETGISDRELLERIDETLERNDPRTWYYALMDYGATLKKKIGNPNRKSLHYTKQSRFEGSLRQARGAVIRYIGTNGEASLERIAASEDIELERIQAAALELVGEGMVAESGGIYRIS